MSLKIEKLPEIADRIAKKVWAFECPKGWEKTDEGCKIKGPGGEYRYYYPDEEAGKPEAKPEQKDDRAKQKQQQVQEDMGGKEVKKTEPAKPLPEHEAKQKTHELLSKMWDNKDDLTVANGAKGVIEKAFTETKKLNEKAKTSELGDDDKANIQRHRQIVDGVMSYLGKRGITKIPGMGKLPAASPAKRFAKLAEKILRKALNESRFKNLFGPVEDVVEQADFVTQLYDNAVQEYKAGDEDMKVVLETLMTNLEELRTNIDLAIKKLDKSKATSETN